MKSFLKVFISILILISIAQNLKALPTYTLTAKNFSLIAPNSMTFEIIMVHTNSEELQYAGGQYFFNFNTAISNGGTLSYSIASDSSDFPPNMRPRNPQISGSQLRLAANSLPGAGNGTILSQNVQWKVIKMRLATSAPQFANALFNILWRNFPTANPVTKINAYVGNANTEITTTNTHKVDYIPLFISINIKLAFEGLYNITSGRHRKQDSVTVYLRSASSPYQMVSSANSIIDSVTLSGNFNYYNAFHGLYYIVVKHKNSLETES